MEKPSTLLRRRGYDVEVYPQPEPPPKSLIIDKVKSGIDGLITTLRDPIDAEVFEAGKNEAGKNTLKVVAQYAVGFDNINRADANRYKIPFTNTPDVLTEATAEFAFFMLGMLARKMWPAEHLTRDNQWGYWHPYLPFLGDEVTGKTIAIIGTGRIGLAMIKKCAGFDMNMLCYDPAYENHDYIKAIQETMDLRPRPRHFPGKELDQVCRFRSQPCARPISSACTCPCCVPAKAPRPPIICSTKKPSG